MACLVACTARSFRYASMTTRPRPSGHLKATFMKTLIIGTGALGQVFGSYLQRGGSSVAYLTKSAKLSRVSSGFQLHHWIGRKTVTSTHFLPDEVFGRLADTGTGWDAIWLCVPSPALQEDWLLRIRERNGSATIVTIGQDVRDRPRLEQVWTAEQVVSIAPSVLAYHAPLEGPSDPIQSGVAYWLPPGATQLAIGNHQHRRAVIDALQAGGMKAKAARTKGTGEMVAAVNMPHFAALERYAWSFDALRARIEGSAAASRQAQQIVGAIHGEKVPSAMMVSPLIMRIAFRLLPRLAPFDIERYAHAHFAKFSGQTRSMLGSWIEEGRARGLPTDRLADLRDAIGES